MKTFEDYIKPLQDKVYRLCLAYTGHAQDAEDLRQESLYRAYKAFHLFENQSSFDTWMYRITVNCCLSWIKRQKKNTLIAEDAATAIELQLDQAATDDQQPAEIDALLACIHQLNEVNRLIVGLTLEGYKQQEIAQVLGMSHSAISVRFHRIKEILKKCMET